MDTQADRGKTYITSADYSVRSTHSWECDMASSSVDTCVPKPKLLETRSIWRTVLRLLTSSIARSRVLQSSDKTIPPWAHTQLLMHSVLRTWTENFDRTASHHGLGLNVNNLHAFAVRRPEHVSAWLCTILPDTAPRKINAAGGMCRP